jgi:hypothetical protein
LRGLQRLGGGQSILPELLEAVGGEVGVAHDVLDRAGVLAVVGELVVAGVVEHMRMAGEGEEKRQSDVF